MLCGQRMYSVTNGEGGFLPSLFNYTNFPEPSLQVYTEDEAHVGTYEILIDTFLMSYNSKLAPTIKLTFEIKCVPKISWDDSVPTEGLQIEYIVMVDEPMTLSFPVEHNP